MRRHAHNLKPEQKVKLARYFEQYPALGVMYEAKQRLMEFLLLKALNPPKVKKILPEFLALIDQFANSPAAAKIGRASCRERVWSWAGGGIVERVRTTR